MPAPVTTDELPDTRLVIGGRRVDAADGGAFEVVDPATGRPIASVADATPEDVDAAIEAASAAFATWRKVPARDRSRTLLAAARLLRDRTHEIARVMTSEQGKPLSEALAEVDASAGFLEWFAGEAERVYGQVVPQQQAHQRILVLRQPVGVTASITPWNFPALMLARKIAPALAAGCTMVVKPASATPLTASALVQCLIDAGVPDGVVGLVSSTRSGDVAGALFADPRVRKVSFTGSTEVGRELIKMSSANVTRLSLELGGHSPYLVFADADLEQSADQIVASKFRNSGQTCVCANRAYVERSVYEQVIDLIKERTEALVLGSGLEPETTMGPLINESAVENVDEHVADAVSGGARLVTGGRRAELHGFEEGSFYEPTILADVHRDMLIAREETFGPALAVAPFDTEAEAIQLANDTPYGLAAYLHTRDYGRLLRVGEELDYGIVGVETGVITAPNAPFAGRKESGYGVEGGSSGIDEYLATKYLLLGNVG
jgi:succinate-semialdehyde dehydrogenase / glutarate-semialdehyde dehydrogenase